MLHLRPPLVPANRSRRGCVCARRWGRPRGACRPSCGAGACCGCASSARARRCFRPRSRPSAPSRRCRTRRTSSRTAARPRGASLAAEPGFDLTPARACTPSDGREGGILSAALYETVCGLAASSTPLAFRASLCPVCVGRGAQVGAGPAGGQPQGAARRAAKGQGGAAGRAALRQGGAPPPPPPGPFPVDGLCLQGAARSSWLLLTPCSAQPGSNRSPPAALLSSVAPACCAAQPAPANLARLAPGAPEVRCGACRAEVAPSPPGVLVARRWRTPRATWTSRTRSAGACTRRATATSSRSSSCRATWPSCTSAWRGSRRCDPWPARLASAVRTQALLILPARSSFSAYSQE